MCFYCLLTFEIELHLYSSNISGPSDWQTANQIGWPIRLATPVQNLSSDRKAVQNAASVILTAS